MREKEAGILSLIFILRFSYILFLHPFVDYEIYCIEVEFAKIY